MPLAKLSIFLCLGIITAESIDISHHQFGYVIGVIGLIILLAIYFHNSSRVAASSLIYISTILIGAATYTVHTKEFVHQHYSDIESNDILIVEVKSKKLNQNNIQCNVRVEYTGNHIDTLIQCNGHLLVYFPIAKADQVEEGSIILLPNNAYKIFENPNPLTFDYKKYLSRKKIYEQAYAYDGQYSILSQNELTFVNKIASKSKRHIQSLIDAYVTKTNNKAIAQAMLLGDRSLVGDDLNTSYSNTGAIHILAVSGLHVGIVGLIIVALLKPFRGLRYSANITLAIALLSIWLYVFMTGSGPPSVRAAAMYTTVLAAPIAGRYLNTYNTIGAAAVGILLYNPHQLFTVSFQFSFMAVLSIIFFFPYLDKLYISPNKLMRKAYQLIILSVSAQILLTPLSIYYFHKFPLLFWLSGMVAVPMAFFILLVSIVMILSSIIPYISEVVTPIAGQILDTSLSFLNYCIDTINQFPLTIIDNIWIDKMGLSIVYSGLFLLMIGLKKEKAKLVYACIGILIAYGFFHFYNKNKEWQEESIIVYHIHKNSIAEYIHNGYLTYLSHSIEKENTETWNCRNYRTYKTVVDTLSKDHSGIEERYGLHNIKGHLVIINPEQQLLDYSCDHTIDLYIINNDNFKLHKSLLDQFNINQVVIDGSVIKSKFRLKKFLEEKSIQFHDTADGAFIYKMKV